MPNTSPEHPSTAHEAVRRALHDLAEAGRRGNADGVSAASMADAVEVSAQYVGKVLAGERVLLPLQVVLVVFDTMRQMARDVVSELIEAWREIGRQSRGKAGL